MTTPFDATRALRRLVDRADISDLLARYAFGLDTRQWDAWGELFTDDVIGEYPAVTYTGRAALVAGISRVGRWAATHHMITNHQIAFDGDGDTARAIGYLHATHVSDALRSDAHYDMGGWYLLDLVRGDNGWRVTHLRLVKSWSSGEEHRSRLRASEDPTFGTDDMTAAWAHLHPLGST